MCAQTERRLEQLRRATDRIQREIEEVTEREHELRNVGSIKTTSHETVDSKVTLKKIYTNPHRDTYTFTSTYKNTHTFATFDIFVYGLN